MRQRMARWWTARGPGAPDERRRRDVDPRPGSDSGPAPAPRRTGGWRSWTSSGSSPARSRVRPRASSSRRTSRPCSASSTARRSSWRRCGSELEKKGQLLSADARREKQDALERKVRDVRRLVDDLQAQLQKKEDALLGRSSRTWPASSSSLGKEKGYTIVSSASARPSSTPAPSGPDRRVLRAYDDQTKKATK